MFGPASWREPTSISRIHDAPAETIPPLESCYFYASPLQLDDPFAPVAAPTTGTTSVVREAPRPFSINDNRAIEDAWSTLRGNIREYEKDIERERIRRLREREGRAASARIRSGAEEASTAASTRFPSRADGRRGSASRDVSVGKRLTQALMDAKQDRLPHAASRETSALSTLNNAETKTGRDRSGSASLRGGPASVAEEPLDALAATNAAQGSFDIGESEQGTTGRPFVRAPTRPKSIKESLEEKSDSAAETSYHMSPQAPLSRKTSAENVGKRKEAPTVKLPVGVQRLYQISMPDLHLEPIYWSPVNDVADVIRGTWFYKDSMLPVEPDVANMLESGYMAIKPWTQTWRDELNSAVAVGPLGEEKIAHQLWPSLPLKAPSSRPGTATSSKTQDDDDTPESRKAKAVKFASDAIDAETRATGLDHKAAGVATWGFDGQPRTYSQCQVIYADHKDAHILRPNLQPSAYYGRKPFADYVRKGRKLGVAVVRGFDRLAWNQIHPAAKSSKAARVAQSESYDASKQPATPSTTWLSDPKPGKSGDPRVTDLVLVVHGIGQKYSERNESFHFTNAMNSFRREINVELNDNTVRPLMRPEMGGVMVLPVNWRSTMSFEDGGYRDEPEIASDSSFSLKDITPESLPHVRNIISDVMLDIPYYLSHHQPRMISAVVHEANRIHRLWCQNNPGFEKYGRTHLLAHSLGSVMAIDILSRQPTRIEEAVTPLEGDEPEHLMFNTSNLYLCGSPAGFFLLLRKAALRPRRDGDKAHGEPGDTAVNVCADEGTYGCVAADNIYNIVNPYDPVAYRMNAAIDSAYAATLRPAHVPRASETWLSALGGSSKTAYSVSATNDSGPSRPGTGVRLPSNVELETHDFNREETAEKRAFLLNDNGQVDFFLRYGGGPLEIQYLTMLGAHSSYWLSRDFIRFLVVETGRKSGRAGALATLRAAKKKTMATR